MIRIFSDCKISYTFPIHKTLAEFFFAKAENVPVAAIFHCLSAAHKLSFSGQNNFYDISAYVAFIHL